MLNPINLYIINDLETNIKSFENYFIDKNATCWNSFDKLDGIDPLIDWKNYMPIIYSTYNNHITHGGHNGRNYYYYRC